jgi:hypothetical protein
VKSLCRLFFESGMHETRGAMRKAPRNCFVVVFVAGLLALLGFSCEKSPQGKVEGSPPAADSAAAADGKEEAKDGLQVIAYYFHNTIRCVSCLKLEKLSRESLESKFRAVLDSGALQWRVVNMELEENKHFVGDYDLSAPSLVLSQVRVGRQVNWKNLTEVWTFLDEPEVFSGYVQKELSEYLKTP